MTPPSIPLPAWRGGQTLRHAGTHTSNDDTFTRIGLLLETTPDDDVIDFIDQILGYGWAVHMRGCDSVTSGLLTVHDELVVIDASPAGRTCRTRDIRQATRDLLAGIESMYQSGSPPRRDGAQLVPLPERALPALSAMYLG
jgi:hypothetical protein